MSAKWRKFMKEARALIDRGAYPEAEQALLAAVREIEVAPDDREFLAETLYETGKLMVQIGSFEEAEEALLRALRIQEEIFGSEDKRVAATITALGKVYAPFENIEAEKQLRKAIAIYEGLNDPDVVFPIECLSLILLVRGRREERRLLLEELNERLQSQSKSKKNAPLLGKSYFLLAQFWDEENEVEAERLLKLALPLIANDDKHAQMASDAALMLAKIQFRQNRYAEAEANFKLALQPIDLISKTSAHSTVEILCKLARLEVVAHRNYSEAQELLTRAAGICNSNIPPLPTTNVILELDRLCEITGQYGVLERLRKELLESYKSIIDEARDRCQTSERVSYASAEACSLSSLLRRQGRVEEAETFAAWAVEMEESGKGVKLVPSLLELAFVAFSLGKIDDANALFDRCIQLKFDDNWYFPQLADALKLSILLNRNTETRRLEQIANGLIDQYSINHEWCTGLCHRLSLVYLEVGNDEQFEKYSARALSEAEKTPASGTLLFAAMMESWAAQYRIAGGANLSDSCEARAAKIRLAAEQSAAVKV